jgi:hypothetical protein
MSLLGDPNSRSADVHARPFVLIDIDPEESAPALCVVRGDTGFVVLREDAPRPGPDNDTPWELICVDCVLDSWPDIAPGLDLARSTEPPNSSAASGGSSSP